MAEDKQLDSSPAAEEANVRDDSASAETRRFKPDESIESSDVVLADAVTGTAPSFPAPGAPPPNPPPNSPPDRRADRGKAPMALLPGAKVDDFEIVRLLGRGAFGHVYLARQQSLDRLVALKVSANRGSEGRTMARLEHQHIVQVFSEKVEPDFNQRLLCMQLVPGIGLEKLVGSLHAKHAGSRSEAPPEWTGAELLAMIDRASSLPAALDPSALHDREALGRMDAVAATAWFGARLAEALDFAHRHGVLHRDIKPANILLYDDDQVKLADFGIARLFGTTQLTNAGGVLGTADYMSPEQAEGRPVTSRCDQYSLGSVMYALLAGRPPFLAVNLPQMLQLQRFAKPEPVRRYAPDTPQQLERIIDQLLSKNPADRYPNTQVLARHLQAMARALSRPAADDFALTGEEPAPQPHVPSVDESLAGEPTRTEPGPDQPALGPGSAVWQKPKRAEPLLEAATVAAADSKPSPAPPSAASVSTPIGEASEPAADRAARFTTLEEEEARQRAQFARPWLLVVGQLAALAGVLGAFAALAYYLSRPPSADQLYETVSASVKNGGEASRSSVENEVGEFLARYPHDPRAAELRQHQERIELDRLERKLLRQARGGGIRDPSLLPAEQLYLQAVQTAETAPEEAAAMLESLVALYAPAAGSDREAEVDAIAQLAGLRLAGLRERIADERARQLKSLDERLEAAAKLADSDPEQSAGMYRAIIDLYGAHDWAAGRVDTARQQLELLENNQVRSHKKL